MRRPAKTAIIVLLCLAAALSVLLLLRVIGTRRGTVAYVTRPVSYANIASSVTETGTVNPVNQVSIGSEVSGTVSTVNADYNSVVHVGEVLATLDPTSLQAAVDSANASLRLANANLSNSKNNVQKSNAQRELSELTLKRDEGLAKQGLIPQSQLDVDRTAALTANLDYLSSQGTVSVAETQVSVAEAQVQQAEYNLSRTIITSPIDGVVLSRSVSVGQSVAASLQSPTLFVLATSLSEMQIDTAVDEADVGSVQKGQPAEITVTAYPNTRFQGTVKEVRVEPTTVQNVVTYDAVVSVHDSTGRLLPGMTAQVVIQTGSRTHVPTVPLAALLYRPASARANGSGAAQGGSAGFAAFGGAVRAPGGTRGGAPTTATAPVAGAPGSRVLVWVLREGVPQPVQITIGMSDERNIEITSNELKVGDEVVVAERTGASSRRSSTGPVGESARQGGPPSGQSPAPASSQTPVPPSGQGPAQTSGQRGRAGN